MPTTNSCTPVLASSNHLFRTYKHPSMNKYRGPNMRHNHPDIRIRTTTRETFHCKHNSRSGVIRSSQLYNSHESCNSYRSRPPRDTLHRTTRLSIRSYKDKRPSIRIIYNSRVQNTPYRSNLKDTCWNKTTTRRRTSSSHTRTMHHRTRRDQNMLRTCRPIDECLNIYPRFHSRYYSPLQALTLENKLHRIEDHCNPTHILRYNLTRPLHCICYIKTQNALFPKDNDTNNLHSHPSRMTRIHTRSRRNTLQKKVSQNTNTLRSRTTCRANKGQA